MNFEEFHKTKSAYVENIIFNRSERIWNPKKLAEKRIQPNIDLHGMNIMTGGIKMKPLNKS